MTKGTGSGQQTTPFCFTDWYFYHVRCKTIETSILHVNNNSFTGPLIIGAFEKRAPFLCPSRLRCSLVRSRETRFARPNRIACSQASSIVACSVRVNGLSVRLPNVGLCSIGKILGWVRLSSITEPNRSQSNDWSSIGFDYGSECSINWLRRALYDSTETH